MQNKSKLSDVPPSTYIQDATSKGLRLAMKIEKATFAPGEQIAITVVARNDSEERLFVIDTYHPEWDTKLDVKEEAGGKVALTEDGERLTKNIAIFRDIRVEINPGDELQKDFVINKLFDMTAPATYSITVKRSFCFSGTNVFMVATSNTVKVTVVD